MATKEERAVEGLKIDPLHKFLAKQFRRFTDTREENQSITMQDALMSGYAVFSLKDPSLLQFNNERTNREENLKSIYKVNKAPSDSGLRAILDEVDLKEVKGIYAGLAKKLRAAGILESYRYFSGHMVVSIDGVHHYSSEKISCSQCLEWIKNNDKKEYRHSLLSAVIVHPEKKEVLPIANEPIVKQDGKTKNDCESNAAKRLIPQVKKLLPKEKVVIVEAALSANGPHIRELKKAGFRFVISVKPDGNKYLFGLMERLEGLGKVNEHEQDHLSKHNVYKMMRTGRSRWKIENETFNTLKNQGYNFEHNYGHGQKNLCTVLALLMMLAFLVDQLQQGGNELFRAAWNKTQTKVALWEKVRQKFNEYAVTSMEMIYKLITGMLKVRYEIIDDCG